MFGIRLSCADVRTDTLHVTNRSRAGLRALLAALAVVSLDACASTSGGIRPTATPSAGAGAAPRAEAILESALALRGTRYRLGGQTPESGFDCSGFVGYVLRLHSIVVPRTVAGQFTIGQPVRRDALRPGDLVFFSTTGPGPTHVGIVLNAAGRQEFVHAPADGSSVRIERFDTPFWDQRWVGGRRLF